MRKGISLRRLAAQVCVSAPFLSDLEHDRRSTTKLPGIALALGVDVAELEALSNRLTQDLKNWIAENPGLVALLREMRTSGREIILDSRRRYRLKGK
jgi:transcriptional regulator with XRE-family HTH domain